MQVNKKISELKINKQTKRCKINKLRHKQTTIIKVSEKAVLTEMEKWSS